MADLNRTTKERLAERPRHVRLWNVMRHPVGFWVRRKVNLSLDDLSDIPAPYLLLCNHTTNLDPIFVGLAMGRQAYFVATENVLHKGRVSQLLMRYFCPIIHQKGRMGLRSAKEIQQTLAAGVSVVLFAEGSRTFNGLTMEIPPVTAKMARKAGRVVCLRMEGGYLTQPRWATTMRRGRLHLAKALVLDAEQMKAMSDAELQAALVGALAEDAYARQEQIASAEGAPVEFAGKHLALGMESTLFMCPDCGRIGTLASDDAGVRCTAPGCGFAASYLPTGYLEGGRFRTITEWDLWQHAELGARVARARGAMDAWREDVARISGDAGPDGEPTTGMPAPPEAAQLFSDHVIVERYNDAHEVTDSVPGFLSVFAGGVDEDGLTPVPGYATFEADGGSNARDTTVRISLKAIESVALFGRNTLIAHVGKPAQHYEVRGTDDLRFNAVKYAYVFDALRG